MERNLAGISWALNPQRLRAPKHSGVVRVRILPPYPDEIVHDRSQSRLPQYNW